MIAIKVELWPYGDRTKAKVLGLAMIANDGTGDKETGNYTAVFQHKPPRGGENRVKVEGFPRLRLNAWDLLYRVLKAGIGDRNP